MKPEPKIHGVMAEFARPEEILAAAKRARAEGYRRMDAFTPFPVEGLAEALGQSRSSVPFFVLCGGVLCGLGGYSLQYYSMVIDYPFNIGGRPLHSWPSFIPVTFELTVLGAALAAFLTVLILSRLPQPYHPVFNAPGFERASVDRFFICIEASDPKFDLDRTKQFLDQLNPEQTIEVAP